ncbi:hypothetical protein T484DRAFT_1817978, partial [Baffinella frigidus]
YPESAADFEKQVTFKGRFDPELAGRLVPRGEICLRGTNIMSGYYKLEAETAEVLDAKKTLSIIDRKKNIFKLAQGEYIAVEPIENVVSKSKFVLQAWVYGNSLENSLVCVVVPDPEPVLAFCKKHDIPGDLEQVCADPSVHAAVLHDIREHCASAGLRGSVNPDSTP